MNGWEGEFIQEKEINVPVADIVIETRLSPMLRTEGSKNRTIAQWGLTPLENYKQSKNFININNIGLPDRKSYIEEKRTTNERKKV